MFRRPDLSVAVLSLALWTLAAPSFAEEAAARSKNGLFPEEIISAEELQKELQGKDKPLLLDARNQKSFEQMHIAGADLPRGEEYHRQEELFRSGMAPAGPDADKALVEWARTIDKDRNTVTYCNSNCHASAALALRLKQLGFTHVRSMEEGIQEWEKKGYPVVRKET
jgi:rhodanese-related sulfurtransferase